jgi:hypothetical protein
MSGTKRPGRRPRPAAHAAWIAGAAQRTLLLLAEGQRRQPALLTFTTPPLAGSASGAPTATAGADRDKAGAALREAVTAQDLLV